MGAWAFLFAEIVSYSQSRSDSVDDLEKRSAIYHVRKAFSWPMSGDRVRETDMV